MFLKLNFILLHYHPHHTRKKWS